MTDTKRDAIEVPEFDPEKVKRYDFDDFGELSETNDGQMGWVQTADFDALLTKYREAYVTIAQMKEDAKHYEAERRSIADFMDMPEPELPITSDALEQYMEYSATCPCRVCAHCRLMLSMLARAEAAEAALAQKDEEIASAYHGEAVSGSRLGDRYEAYCKIADPKKFLTFSGWINQRITDAESAESSLAALRESSTKVREEAIRECSLVISSLRCDSLTRKEESAIRRAILSLLPAPPSPTEEPTA